MWQLVKARGQFRRHNPPLDSTCADVSDDVMQAAARVLGPVNRDGLRGNFQLLDEVLASVRVTGTTGGRTSEGTYCGVSALPATAESEAHLKGAWIAISPGYVALIERVSAIAVAFPQVLRAVFVAERDHGEHMALEMLGNIRSSAFHYWGMLWHEADPAFDTPEFWEPLIGTPECLAVARAAVTFTILHELAHLTQGDSSTRIDKPLGNARLERARQMPPEMWPELTAHQAELSADCTAVDTYASSPGLVDSLGTAMTGSIVATVVAALDGWNQDQASFSESHPSPFLRLECLLLYWCEALRRGQSDGWSEIDRPSPESLEQFAQTWGLGAWAAGRYREGRDGLGLFNDINDSWGFVLAASGHTGTFRNAHAQS